MGPKEPRTLRASHSGTFLQALPELVKALKECDLFYTISRGRSTKVSQNEGDEVEYT